MLSVVTITRDDAVGLQATAHSLLPLMKSGIEWQHVVVDGSPEITSPVLGSLVTGWPLLHVKSVPRGIYAALNEGAAFATGDVVWFLNGGDQLRDLGTLSRLLARLEERPDLELICAAADGVRDGVYQYTHVPKHDFGENLAGHNSICHQSVLYRRSTLRELGEYSTDYRIAGDYEHHLRCLCMNMTVECRPDRLVEFDMSGTSTNWRLALREFRQALEAHRHELPWRFYRRAVARLRVEWIRIYAVKHLAQSSWAGVLLPVWQRWHRLRAGWAGATE